MVINHLDKLFVTSDAATIIRELEVVHPAGKVLVMASQQQEHEVRWSEFAWFGCWGSIGGMSGGWATGRRRSESSCVLSIQVGVPPLPAQDYASADSDFIQPRRWETEPTSS